MDELVRYYESQNSNLIAYVTFKNSDALSENYSEKIKEKFNDVKYYSDQINELLDKSKKAIGQIGITEYARIFEQDAFKYQKWSTFWIWTATITAIAGSIIIYFVLLDNSISHSKNEILMKYEFFKFWGIRLFILSILYILVTFFIKNYNANKHNAVLNRHRSNAMKTFELFKESANDEITQDTILRQATEAIFSIQYSGYGSKDSHASPIRQFTEIFPLNNKKE